MDNNEKIIAESIYNELVKFDVAWDKVVFYAEISKDNYMMEFYMPDKNGKYVKCYNIDNITDEELNKAFEQIFNAVNPIWLNLDEKNQWSNLTFIVDNEGNFQINYDYTDLTENCYEYRKQWKNKYLNI